VTIIRNPLCTADQQVSYYRYCTVDPPGGKKGVNNGFILGIHWTEHTSSLTGGRGQEVRTIELEWWTNPDSSDRSRICHSCAWWSI